MMYPKIDAEIPDQSFEYDGAVCPDRPNSYLHLARVTNQHCVAHRCGSFREEGCRIVRIVSCDHASLALDRKQRIQANFLTSTLTLRIELFNSCHPVSISQFRSYVVHIFNDPIIHRIKRNLSAFVALKRDGCSKE